MAESKLDEMIRLGQGPSVVRTSRGPGSCSSEIVFDRPDMKKEIPMTLAKMELAGKFHNNPDAMAAAKIKYDESKHTPPSNVDYQKEGHPLD